MSDCLLCHCVLVGIAVYTRVENSFLCVAALPTLLGVACAEFSAVDQDSRC
jgi:hypothetical protein